MTLRALAFAFALVAAGCAPSTTSTIPIESTPPAPADTAASSTIDASATPAVGQTDTSWGRIWDEVPDGFPRFPGGLPAGGTSESVSAGFTYDGVEPRSIASWMQLQLERTSFTTEGFNGPLEDGGYVLDSVGPGGCRIQVKAAPMGSLTSLIVRYGAACPAP